MQRHLVVEFPLERLIVDNQLNSTFGNRHSVQPIGGIHYWLAYQQNRLDSNWPFCITLRQ